ncbi:Pimeloyl-ACP methyl ester carboxylesterase [Nocardia amikacinitolerans]|uniref:alpha/beta fold hydrolase n=1 Tax=Nocardia amikacinitolerans TaxID=756689 RepID=UPI00082D3F1E|nr:alpha/beta hydrolase [Nocardia amikacinitolerans]MCP2316361.1 Pimeloyl-ACP methyl ester carboxylesterase [Nocardia amikacinitolerans]
METITTPGGVELAFDRTVGGEAGTVILIGGAFSYRAFPKMVELARKLSQEYGLTVVNYDRRGRGDSTDSPGVYDVENEIDDLAALIEAVGGEAAVFGWSSGAGLALLAAASGRVPGITKVVAFEPPFVTDHENFVPPADLAVKLHELIAADRRAEVVRYFMTKGMGTPRLFAAIMRFTPFWKSLLATAPSTAHDWAIMGPYMRGSALSPADWAGVKVPTLVVSGGKSGALLRSAARAITAVLPNARHEEVAKLSHNPNIDLLVPVSGEFLVGAERFAA